MYLTESQKLNVFVPFQGIHFFNLNEEADGVVIELVFVPFQGIHFFNRSHNYLTNVFQGKVFVPFQGIHFFNRYILKPEKSRKEIGFRPFSGNSFL